MTHLGTIRIAATLLDRHDGHTLLVRKRGTTAFMQAGGKIKPGEDAVAALCRELLEELGLIVGLDVPRYLGRFQAPAANEADCIVDAEMFQLELFGPVTAAAEIEELAWVDPSSPGRLLLAPFTRDHVLTSVLQGSSLIERLWPLKASSARIPRSPSRAASSGVALDRDGDPIPQRLLRERHA